MCKYIQFHLYSHSRPISYINQQCRCDYKYISMDFSILIKWRFFSLGFGIVSSFLRSSNAIITTTNLINLNRYAKCQNLRITISYFIYNVTQYPNTHTHTHSKITTEKLERKEPNWMNNSTEKKFCLISTENTYLYILHIRSEALNWLATRNGTTLVPVIVWHSLRQSTDFNGNVLHQTIVWRSIFWFL